MAMETPQPLPPPETEIPFERFGGGEARLVKLCWENITGIDLARIAEICNQEKVHKWVTQRYSHGPKRTYAYSSEPVESYTLEDAMAYVNSADKGWGENNLFTYLIRGAANKIVGSMDVKSANREAAEIGYWSDTEDEQSRGYMTNALIALCEAAKRAGYRSLYARAKGPNPRSHGVLKRAGFINEGLINKDDPNGYLKFTIQLDAVPNEDH